MTIKSASGLSTETTTNITQNSTKSNTGANLQALLLNIIASMYGDVVVSIDNTDSPYTVDYDTVRVLICDTSSGAVTVALPAVASNVNKGLLVMCTSASNDLTIDPNSSETINGASALVLSGAFAGARLTNDGTTHYAFLTG